MVPGMHVQARRFRHHAEYGPAKPVVFSSRILSALDPDNVDDIR